MNQILRKRFPLLITVLAAIWIICCPLSVCASDLSTEEVSLTGEIFTVGDNVTARLVKEGTINVLYFDSFEGTLWKNWRSKIGNSVKKIDIIRFSSGSSEMFFPANSEYLFGSNHNHNESYPLENLERIELDKANTSHVTIMTGLFAGCRNLKKVDLSSFDTKNVKRMGSMFDSCSSLTSVDLSSFDTPVLEEMYLMFYNCRSLTSVNFNGMDTSHTKHMYEMFSGCRSLKRIDLSTFNTINAENMSGMFSDCSSLTNLDLSNFNTTSVRSMAYMFKNCTSLKSVDLSGFATVLLHDMYKMFSGCSSLRTLDLSSFNTTNVYSMYEMFSGCTGLKSLKTPVKNVIKADLPFRMYDDKDREYLTLPAVADSISLTKRTSIEKASVAGVSLSYGYSGSAYKPDLTVIVNGRELVEDKDYTVKYEDNKKPGTGKITIKGVGKYVGTRIKTFKIVECASELVSGKTYQIIPKNESATAVCAFGGRMMNNTRVYITNRSESEAMRFKAVENDDGTWKFINAKCELALSVRENSRETGAGVVIYDQTGEKAQNWKLSKRFDNSFAILNAVTEYSIELSDASALKGTSLSMEEKNSSGLQRFYFVETDEVDSEFDGTYVFRIAEDKKYALNISASSKEEGANVDVYTYREEDAFKFKILHSGKGYYRLVNVNSGLVVTVSGNTKAGGANVIQSVWKGESGQRWKITKNSDGTVTLMSALGTVLTGNGEEIKDGTNIVAGKSTEAKTQKWYMK